MTDGPIERIVRESGVPDLVEILSERLSPTDLQSLMLEVFRRRAARMPERELLSRYADNRFVRPARVEARALADFERTAFSLLPEGYEPLELSPLCPIGTNSVVATVDQNKVVSTVRNVEVVADSTNVLALECALRRRQLLTDQKSRFAPVFLAASQRQVRAQTFGGPQETAHFQLVGLVAAGRDRGSFTFEIEALFDQISYLIELVRRTRTDWQLDAAFTDLGGRPERLEDGLLAQLSRRWPGSTFRLDPLRASGRGYYVDACFKLFARGPGEEVVELADGGCTTWTRKLLSDEKERLVISGLGVERLLV